MSKDPSNQVLGLKYYNINDNWALKPYYLGPGTLRDLVWGFTVEGLEEGLHRS